MWQHSTCVGINSAKGVPEHFFCELCTLERSNPFWKCATAERKLLIPPAVLQPQNLPVRVVLPGLTGWHSSGLHMSAVCVPCAAAHVLKHLACCSCLQGARVDCMPLLTPCIGKVAAFAVSGLSLQRIADEAACMRRPLTRGCWPRTSCRQSTVPSPSAPLS